MTRRIGLIAYPRFTTLDLTGPLDVFDIANAYVPGSYETLVLAASADPLASEAGLQIVPHATLAKAPPLYTILVPGGYGLRKTEAGAPIVAFLKARRRTRRIASVCTGIYA